MTVYTTQLSFQVSVCFSCVSGPTMKISRDSDVVGATSGKYRFRTLPVLATKQMSSRDLRIHAVL